MNTKLFTNNFAPQNNNLKIGGAKLFTAVSILVGTIVGAGFLGIPYVVGKSGFLIGMLYLVFISLLMIYVNLSLGEVSLRTKGNHQLTGYAEKYLGKSGKILMFFAMLFGIYSALLAYLMGEGESLSFLIFGNLTHAFTISLIFWVIMCFLTYIGLVALKKYEKIAMPLVWLMILLIVIFFSKTINPQNLVYTNLSYVFLPFGVILFSFLAFSAMPEVKRVLLGNEKLMKKTIISSGLIALAVYFIFALIVVGNFGTNVPEVATLSLGRFFSILGILTMFTASFAGSIAIRDMFRFDFKFGRFLGWILANLIPLALFLIIHFFNILSFISILGIAGVISGGLTGILIMLMNKKAKKFGDRKPEYSLKSGWIIITIISLIFIAGVLLEILR